MNLDDIINSLGRRAPRVAAYDASPAQRLRRWWIAERSAPVLLEYQEALLQEVIASARALRDYIEETSIDLMESQEGAQPSAHGLGELKTQLLLCESELERVKYVARSYKRARLAKIDMTPLYYLKLQDTPEKCMSKDEWIYCHRRTELESASYFSGFLHNFPPDLQSLTEEEGQISMVDEPDVDKPVPIRAQEDLGVRLVGSEEVQLEKNGLYLLRFSAISDLLSHITLL